MKPKYKIGAWVKLGSEVQQVDETHVVTDAQRSWVMYRLTNFMGLVDEEIIDGEMVLKNT